MTFLLPEIDRILQQAVQDHQSGRLAEAEAGYRKVLSANRDHFDALHLLGVLALQMGQAQVALQLLQRAIQIEPRSADAQQNLGNAYLATGNVENAIGAFKIAIQLNPGSASVFHRLGNALQAKSDWEAAIGAYREALRLEPASASIRNSLASAWQNKGQIAEAMAEYRRIIADNPDFAEAYNNLGNAFSANKQLNEAITTYRKAMQLKADYHDAAFNLGLALAETGDFDEAISVLRDVVRTKPGHGPARIGLGNALAGRGYFDEAVTSYRSALEIRPQDSQAWLGLGNAYHALGQVSDAANAYERAVLLEPGSAANHSNLGNVLREMGRIDEAIVECRRALRLNPNSAEAHNNLGLALRADGQFEEARDSFQEAIQLSPETAQIHNNLGNALRSLGNLDGAVLSFQEAIRLDPKYADTFRNLGNVYKDMGEIDLAIASYRRAVEIDPSCPEVHGNLVYALSFNPKSTTEDILAESLEWDRRHAQRLRSRIRPHSNDPSPERPLKIGYVSPDLRQHVVGANLEPLLRHHNREQYHVYCYANNSRHDAFTERLRGHAHAWREITGVPDDAVAEAIRADKIDILVDLALHGAGNRLMLFARKPAPIQVTYLGYCGATGLEAIDYRLSDPYIDPEDSDLSCYREETIRLPHTYWCYQPLGDTPPINPLPALDAGYVTFGCLNNLGKVSRPALDLWIQILASTPRSRLLLQVPAGSPRTKLLEYFSRNGIASNRVTFADRASWARFLQNYQAMDIALDPFPFNGGITSCDALWMGVPVVTLSGKTSVGRGGRSILSNLGLPRLIAATPGEYCEIAHDLAADLSRLSDMRAGLRERMEHSPLRDATGFADDVEMVYRQIWRKWCDHK